MPMMIPARILRSHSGTRAMYEDIQTRKMREETVGERISRYVHEKGNPEEYDIEELKEKSLVLDWVACQLVYQRIIKTKQLFIYGEPSTQKTLLINMIARVLRVYFVGVRKNEFEDPKPGLV